MKYLFILLLIPIAAHAQTVTITVGAEVRNLKIVDEICEDNRVHDDCIQIAENTEEEQEWIDRMRDTIEEREHIDY